MIFPLSFTRVLGFDQFMMEHPVEGLKTSFNKLFHIKFSGVFEEIFRSLFSRIGTT